MLSHICDTIFIIRLRRYLRSCLFLAGDIFMNMKLADIGLKIRPAGSLSLPWPDCDRAVILINKRDILHLVMKAQDKNGREEKFCYHHMPPSALYEGLLESEKSAGEESAALLCCTCDYSECGAVITNVIKTKDCVVWKDIRDKDREDYFSFSYTFSSECYKEFMRRLKKAASKEKYTQ